MISSLAGMIGWARLSLLLAGESASMLRIYMGLNWTASYFLWDTLDAAINFDDLGFLIHGKLYRHRSLFGRSLLS